MIQRHLYKTIITGLQNNPAVALLGPRQIGKTTLAQQIATEYPSVYLDLENPADAAKLQDPIHYLAEQTGKLVILDEIQRTPELFQPLRSIIDQNRSQGNGTGQFLILGSASIDLLKQSSESLAGRIHYLELDGLSPREASSVALNTLWLRGGFPRSVLASTENASTEWREDFIRTYLERDIPQLGPRIPATTLRRFWKMLAHLQGSNLNAAQLASGLDVSSTTILRYVDLMVDLLLVRRLQPWFVNTGKRLIKSPKVYVRDSGIMHQLLGITDFDDLISHPIVGMSWEGFVIENLLCSIPRSAEAFFYRTSSGIEIDLLLQLPSQELWAIEIKKTLAPKVGKAFYKGCEDVKPTQKFIVYAGEETYPLSRDIEAISLPSLMHKLEKAPS